ncbi:DUSAM domain-containing protein [Corallococcus sp. CA047B]|uniref:DUSAM domain-containing protein n=1 Tax=Corallococcus sp. CA047B TaxID=2316729 RepID=UPI000EA11F12|nr:DUSAM domain-containing protein [Corallococcus sp. CA047B]RKH11159.1 DUSAM domain-containing protein [Corallococcus sp. CA047B]
MPDQRDWDAVSDLDRDLRNGTALEITEELRDLLRRTAVDVAIPAAEAERALQREADAATLTTEVARRIREGSRRLSRALTESTRRQEAGDMNGARQALRDAQAVEVVPLYVDIAQIQLESLDGD